VRSVTGAARAADETNRASTLGVRSNTVVEYVYGPVLSRRLGRSLGVDLVPLKICTYDCVYCQLGRTTSKTLERREYVPLPDVLSQLDRRLRDEPALDFITLAGSGEPTLYARLPEVIRAVKQRTATPLAVLTNGSLLWDPQVRDSLREADLVIPSLDAGDERLFQYVNRPHDDIAFEKMVEGLVAFRQEFAKPIWLEVFLLGGVTAIDAEVQTIVHLVDQIKPDRVQLNTVARPPAEAFAIPVPDDQLRGFAAMFGDRAEVIAEPQGLPPEPGHPVTDEQMLALVARRPCTLRDIAEALGLHPAEALKRLGRLLGERENGRC
jgi:wyosine [tRNA(Phe)-imidazoG37] synthetase (radical SAM superfamily)